MRKVHDRGGWPSDEPIERTEHQIEDWERTTDALVYTLNRKGLINVDQLRMAIEALPRDEYERYSYYERWAAALESLLVEKHILTRKEIDLRAAWLADRWGGP